MNCASKFRQTKQETTHVCGPDGNVSHISRDHVGDGDATAAAVDDEPSLSEQADDSEDPFTQVCVCVWYVCMNII
jgi:hypothetical protein